MSLLRRLFGGGDEAGDEGRAGGAAAEPPPSGAELEAAEQERERELLRAEAGRLDELRQRQLRYADRAWTPPRQGGERRADDEDAPAD